MLCWRCCALEHLPFHHTPAVLTHILLLGSLLLSVVPQAVPPPSAVVFHRRGEALPWAGQIFLPHADVWVLQGIPEGTWYPCMGGWPESSHEPQGQGWGSER